jgi:hypothetical protein
MSTLQSRRSPLDVIRALREAKKLGSAVPLDPGFRESLAEALEPRQLLTVTGATITPPLAATEGNSAIFTESATTNHDPAATTWTIGFGDGASYVGSFTATTTIAHTYADSGNYSVMAQVTDGTGSYYYCSTTISVADATLSPAGGMNTTDIGVAEGESYGGVVADFTDANPLATTADFAASISFGDGTTIGGSIVTDGSGGFDVVGSHTYTEQGSYGGYVHIVDDGGATLYMYLDAAITDASITATTGTATFAEGQSQTVTAITFQDANPYETGSDLTATIDWGDGTSIAGTIVSEGGGNFKVTGVHSYAAAGTFSGWAEVSDTGGASAGASFTGTSASITSMTVTNDYDDTQTETTPTSSDTLLMAAPSYSTTASISAGISPSGSAAATDAAVYKELDPTGATIASGSLGSGADIPINWAPYDDGASLTIEAGIQTTAGATTWMQTMQVARQHLTLAYSDSTAKGTGIDDDQRLQVNAGGNATFQSITAEDQNGNASATKYTTTVTSLSPVAIVTTFVITPALQGSGTTNFTIGVPAGTPTGQYNISVTAVDDPSRSIIIYIKV